MIDETVRYSDVADLVHSHNNDVIIINNNNTILIKSSKNKTQFIEMFGDEYVIMNQYPELSPDDQMLIMTEMDIFDVDYHYTLGLISEIINRHKSDRDMHAELIKIKNFIIGHPTKLITRDQTFVSVLNNSHYMKEDFMYTGFMSTSSDAKKLITRIEDIKLGRLSKRSAAQYQATFKTNDGDVEYPPETLPRTFGRTGADFRDPSQNFCNIDIGKITFPRHPIIIKESKKNTSDYFEIAIQNGKNYAHFEQIML